MRVAIVAGRFNEHVTKPLLAGAQAELAGHGLDPATVPVVWVPGAFEIPLAAKRLAASGTVDGVICVGAVIQGETSHFEYVAGPCAAGIAQAALDTGVPVAFGVLTTRDERQALDRAGGPAGNKGAEAARTALEMVALLRALPRGAPMLNLVLPKGSLEAATLALFDDADLGVQRSSDVEYRATIDDPRVAGVRILRPQEIPRYVADGLFDLGVTGRDWVEETGADVVTLGDLAYSKTTGRGVRLVLAVAADHPAASVDELHDGLRVHTEYPELTRRYFVDHGLKAEVSLSYGATEAKVPDIADAVVELTETGRALRAAGLRILDTVLASSTVLIANPAAHRDPAKRKAMEQLHTLLDGALEARGKVLLKLNVDEGALTRVLELLPALKAPTVSKLSGGDAYAVEIGRGEGRDQHADPGAEGAGRDGDHRDPHRQDRPLMDGPRRRVRPGPRARHGRGRAGSPVRVPLHPAHRRPPRRRRRDPGPVPGRPRPPRAVGGRRGRRVRLSRAPRSRCGCGPGSPSRSGSPPC